MIQQAVTNFDAARDLIRARFESAWPGSYKGILLVVIEEITGEEYGDFAPDPQRIHQIDDGDWQGTLVFVIGSKGYQPNDYFATKVYYGSCSVCDTLQSIEENYQTYEDESDIDQDRRKKAVDGLMTLALHLVQRMKEI